MPKPKTGQVQRWVHSAMRWLSAGIISLLVLAWLSPDGGVAEVRASPWKNRDYYAWIVFLSERRGAGRLNASVSHAPETVPTVSCLQGLP